MKCKCGGELKRIAIDCFQCDKCILKYKVAFIEPNTNFNAAVNINFSADTKHIEAVSKQIEQEIRNKLNAVAVGSLLKIYR